MRTPLQSVSSISRTAAGYAANMRGIAATHVDGLVATGAPPGRAKRSLVTAEPVAARAAADEACAAVRRAGEVNLVVASAAVSHTEEARRLLIERAMLDSKSDADGLGFKGEQDELLRGLLSAAYLAMEKRYAPSTGRLDQSYWRMWGEWCQRMGTPPLRTNESANAGHDAALHRREVALALGFFMSSVAEAKQKGYKVISMMQRLRGVARRHSAVGLRFASLSLVVQAAAGLVQEHIDIHGAESLEPKSKEPLLTTEIVAILNLPPGTTIVEGIVVGENIEWQSVRVMIALFCTAGFRKEAVGIGRGEAFGPRKLGLFQVTYRFHGVLTRTPRRRQLLEIAVGAMSYITPVPCKNDRDNKKFGATPIPSRYHPTRAINLCRELAKFEAMRMLIAGVDAFELAERRTMPLIISPRAVSFTKREIDDLFKKLIRLVATEERARQLSMHSFRVWLASALLAVGATPEQIMLLLRWSSEAAKRLYARMADSTKTSMLDTAQDVSFESVRAHTLMEIQGEAAAAAAGAELEAGKVLGGHDRLLSDATADGAPAVTSAALARAGVETDDDGVYAAVLAGRDALEAMAAQADARSGEEVGVDDDDEDSD